MVISKDFIAIFFYCFPNSSNFFFPKTIDPENFPIFAPKKKGWTPGLPQRLAKVITTMVARSTLVRLGGFSQI
jgi:hypothetical protein